jgi:hypothetical protein
VAAKPITAFEGTTPGEMIDEIDDERLLVTWGRAVSRRRFAMFGPEKCRSRMATRYHFSGDSPIRRS